MYLDKITLSNFKNISRETLDFSHRINCITGRNGSGKTNLLDAVYYLSMTKSYFSVNDSFTMRHGETSTFLNAEYLSPDNSIENISISICCDSEKVVKRNSKSYSRLSDHIGLIPVVMISPSDTNLIHDSGEERRRFVNSILSQIDRNYLRAVQKYNQLLYQRNKLLKGVVNEELLSVYSEQIARYASEIYGARKEFCKNLEPLTIHYYEKLSGGKEQITLSYKSDLDRGDMETLLKESIDKDRALKHTTVGIHRDDLLFEMNGYPIRKVGSQGQQKSFLISLKLSQYALFGKAGMTTPILLLDDVFDKLDSERVELLLRLVSSEEFGQIFITDSNKVRLDRIMDSIGEEYKSFEIEKGGVL